MSLRLTRPIFCASILLALMPCARAQSLGVSLEAEKGILAKLQTAFLFNVARFVNWPREDGKVRLCLENDSPLARFAREIDGRDLGDGRKLVITVGATQNDVCDLAFEHSGDENKGHSAAPAARSNATLTVSDRSDALQRGFAMQFFLEADNLRFAVNNDVVARAEYRVSSKLLRLARPAR